MSISFAPKARLISAILVVMGIGVAMARPAAADIIYWNGTTSPGNVWSDVNAWSTTTSATTPPPIARPGASDDVVFNVSTDNSNETVRLNGAQSALSILFRSTGTTTLLGGTDGTPANDTLTLGAGGLTLQSGAGAVTIGQTASPGQVAVALAASQTWTNNSSSLLTVANGISRANGDTTNRTLTIAGSGNTAIDGAIADGGSGGTLGLSKTGNGTLTLSGTNSFTGATTVSAGTLTLSGANGALGSTSGIAIFGTGSLTLSNTAAANNGDRLNNAAGLTATGGTFNFTHDAAAATNYAEMIGALSIAGGAFRANLSQAATDQTSAVTAASWARSNGGTALLSGIGLGVDTRSRFIFTAAPTVTNSVLQGAVHLNGSTYSLATYDSINGVAALASTNTAEGSWTDTINARPTADVTVAAARSLNSLVLDAGIDLLGPAADRTITFTNGSGSILQTGGTSEFNANGTNEYILAFGSGEGVFHVYGTLNFAKGNAAAQITGSGGITKSGNGILNLNNVPSNNSGPVRINQGTLRLTAVANANASGAGTLGQSSNAATNLVLNGGTLQLSGATSAQTTDRLFTLGLGGGTLDSSAGTGGSLAFSGTGALEFLGSGPRTLGLTGTTAGSLAAVIGNDAGGATGIAKSGTNTWSLAGANTFSGPITISAGTLQFSNTAAQTLAGPITGDGSLSQSGSGMTLLTGSRTASGGGNLLSITATGAGALSIAGPVTSATPQTLSNASTAGGVLTVAGRVDMGSNLLTISGAGTTRLTNTQGGGSASVLGGNVAVPSSTLVAYAPAAGAVGGGSASSLGTGGVTLSGTNPVLRLAPALGTSLAGGTSPGLFAKGYSGATTLAGNNFLSQSNAITTMAGNFAYLNVPVGGAIIPNVPVFAVSTDFPTSTSFQITGLLNVTTAGNYTFGTATDDFGSLQVDGSSPIVSAVNTVSGSLYLSAGLHTISYRGGNGSAGGGRIGLQYQGPDQPTLGSIPASAFFVANNAADLTTTFTNPVTLAATTSGTIDIASNTTVSSVQMSGTGAGTVLNATGSGNISRLTINSLTLTDSLTLGQTATNPTALMSLGTIDNTSASPVTLTLGNNANNFVNPNTIAGGITQSGGGAVSVTQTGSGYWMLSGTNTYTGPTAISAGTLTLGSPASLYNNTPASWTPANVTIASGAALGVGMGGAGQWTSADVATLLTNLDAAFVSGTSLGVDVSGGNAATLSTNIGNTAAGANALPLVKLGSGSLTLSGTNTYTGDTVVTGGTLNVTGSLTGNGTTGAGSTLRFGTAAVPSVVNLSGSVSTYYTFLGATVPGAVAVYNQTAGTANYTATNTNNTTALVSNAAGGFGAMNITGGTTNVLGRYILNRNGTATGYVGGTGVLNLTGEWGMIMYGNANTSGSLTIGPGGVVNRAGATNRFGIFMDQAGQYGVMNIAGGSFVTTTQPVVFGNSNGGTNNVGFLNLAQGTLQTGTNVIQNVGTSTGQVAYINAAGGTLRATAALTAALPATVTGQTVVGTIFGPIDNSAAVGNTSQNFTGGLVIDTNGFAVTIPTVLANSSGFGVTQANIAIPSAGNSGYVAAPFVRFSNPAGGGVPAAGYAVIGGGQVTGIVITSPGTYAQNEQPTITLTGGGGSIAAFQTAALATANTSGGLIKTGDNTLTFAGLNTFTGPVTVSAGNVAVGNGGRLSASQLAANEQIGRSVIIAAGGAIVGDTSASLFAMNRIVNGSGGGAVAITAATAGQDVNLGPGGFNLPGMSLGASGGTVTYTGTFTPGTASVFNLGGGGGTLVFPQAITGTASVNVSAGTVALTGSSNTFTGGLTLAANGVLQLTAGNAAGGAFGNTRLGLVSQGGTIRWESGATTDITSGAGKIASTGSGGVSVNFAAGTTTLDTNGNTVTLAGAVGYGSGAIQKTTAGTLVLAGPTNLANPFTGGTTISTGAIQLANPTALRHSTVTNSVANGLTFAAGNSPFTIGGLAGASNIALTDTASAAVQLRVGANNLSNTFTGVLSGANGQFVKVGVGVQTFTTATQTYTGLTAITGGISNTNLANSGNGAVSTSGITLAPTGASTNLLNPSSPLQFGSTTLELPGGGTFTMTGHNSAVTNAQTFASTTVVGGFSSTSLTSNNTGNAVTLTLNALSRTAVTRGATAADAATGGGTINFTALANGGATNQVATTTTTANDSTGILGAWAFTGNANYAAVNASSQIVAYTGYTTVTGGTNAGSTTQNALFNTGASVNTATVDYNTVKFGTATANFFATATNTLRLGAVGGLLFPTGNAATTVGTGANNGIITAGGTTANNPGELIVFSGSANALTINSTITNNGTGAVTLVKTGSGNVTLGGTNTYSGGTIVQQGRINVTTNASAFGTGAVTILPGGQMYATGGTFANNFFIAGSGINDNPNYGAIRLDSGATVSGNVTLVGDAVIGTNSGTNTTGGTFSGAISGNFSLFKSAGQGRIILSGANTYTGATVAQIGVLQFGTGTASTQSYSSLAAQSVYAGGYPGGTAATSGNTVFVNTSTAGDFQNFLATKANPASTGTFAFANAEAASNIDFAAAGLANAWLMAGAPTTYTGTFTPGTPGQFRFGGGDITGALTFQSNIADYSPVARSSVTIGQTNTNTVGFTGSNTYSGGFSLGVGTYQLGASLGQQFGAAAPGIAGVTMTGGTIQWQASTTVDLSGVTGGLTFTGGTFDTNGNNVSLATPFNPGSTALTRTGTGTLTLGSTAPIYGWTGSLTSSGGAGTILLNSASSVGPTAQLTIANVASNTIRLGTTLTAGAISGGGTTGGILDLNGNVLTTGFSNATTTYTGQITSTASASTAALTKTGSGTFTWRPRSAAANYTGATTIRGGVLSLDLGSGDTTVNTQPINVGSALVLGGGGLTLTGKASQTQAQAFASTTLQPGGNSVNVSGNNATANPLSVDLKALTRNVGATIDFVNPTNGTLSLTNGITTSALNGNFTAAGGSQTILGGYATVAGTGWAVTANSGANNFVTALASYNAGFTAGTNVDAPVGASAPGAMAVNSLRFNAAGAATVDATGGLTVASGGILVTGTVGTANGVTFANGTLATGNGADLIVINNNGNATTGAVTINSQITGGPGIALTKSGGGYLVLGNVANDYGTTYLNAGILRVSAPGNLGSGPVIMGNNAAVAGTRLEFAAGGFTAPNPITVNATLPLTGGGVGLIHYVGPAGQFVTLAGTVEIGMLSSAGGHIGSATSTGGFIINGPITAPYGVNVTMRNGTNTLSGGGTYYSMILSEQTLRIGANNGISTLAVLNVAASGAGTVDLNGFNQTLEGLTQTANNAATVTNSGVNPVTLTLNAASAWESYTYGSQATAGTITGNLNIVKTGSGTQTIAGPIATTGGVTVNAGTLVLSAANSFTGAVTVNGGSLRVANARALGLTTGFGSGTILVNGGSLDLNGIANVAAGSFSGTGGVVTDTSYGTGTSVFSVSSNSSGSFAGSINDFTGNAFNRSMAFTKDGSGTLTLTGASTYTGLTTVFGGALNARNAAALGATSAGTSVFTGAAVEVEGGIATAEPFTINGTGIAAAGAIRSISGSNTLSGPITLSTAARINADAGLLTLGGTINIGGASLTLGGGGDLAVGGGINAGAGGLVKDGAGLATLSGANAYGGTTTVSAGTVRVTSGTGLGTAAEGTTVGTAGVLQLQGGITVAGESLVTPILQSVSGTNTWTGSITAQNQASLTLRSDADTLTISGAIDARSADATNQALVLTGVGGGTITQAIANPASVTKSGGGTWVLSGANIYAAATTVTGGTLRAGGATTLSANSAINLANAAGAMLDLDGFANTIAALDGGGAAGGNVLLGAGSLTMGANTTYGGQVSGTTGSGLTKTGAGAFSLGSTGSVTGTVALAVSGGTFYANGSLGTSVTTTVAAGAGLGGSGTVGGPVSVASGGSIVAGDAANVGQLTLGDLALGATAGDTAAVQLFNIGIGGSASIVNAANITANGGTGSVTIFATNSGALANGTYNLIGYTGTLSDFSVFKTVPGSITGLSGRQSGTLLNTSGTTNYVQLVVAGDSPKWTGFNALTSTQDLVWAVPSTGGPENWTLIGANTPTDYQAGDSVLFSDSAGSGNTTVNIDQGSVSPTSVTIDNATLGYVFNSTGGFGIAGATGIVKTGAGAATFNTSNAFAGGLTVNAGSLILNAANTFTGGIDINGAGIVTLGAAGAVGTANEVVFGPGSTGQFRLNGRNATLLGLTTDATTAGTPVVKNGDAATASTLTLDFAGSDAFAGVFEDGGAAPLALTLQGGGTLVLTGANTATGVASLAGAGTTLQVGTGGTAGSLASDTSLAVGTVLRFDLAASRTYAGGITGAGSLVAQGGGTLVLTGNAGHAGGTTIAAGQTLQVGGGGSSGDLSGTGVIANAGSLAFDRTGTATIQAQITGTGGLTTSAGTLVLTATNTYQGATTVGSGSTLQMGDGGTTGTLGSAATVTTNGMLAVSRSDSLTFGTNVVGSGGFDARMAGGGILTLTGTNAYAGGTTVTSGTLRLGVSAAFPTLTGITVGGTGTAGTFDLNNIGISVSSLATAGTAASQTITNTATGTAILTYAGAGTSTFGGGIQDTSGTQRIGVTINGGGTLRLARANAYTGGTIVADGTAQLAADNAFPAGGLTLGGTGTAGILDLAGFNQTISGLTVGSGATAASQQIGNSSTTADSVLTYTGGNITWPLSIQDTLGAGSRKTGLTLAGSSIFTVVTANTFTGPTTINPGSTLRIGAGGTIGSLAATPIVNAGTLIFNRTDTYTMPAGNTVTGAGAVTIAAGTVATSAVGLFNSTGLLTLGSGSTVANLDLTDGGGAFGGLTVATNTTFANTITIGTGRTLAINGNVAVGNGTNNGQAVATVTGGGTLAVTGTNFNVGGTIGTTNNASRATLNLSGLANLTVSVSNALTIQPTGDNSGGVSSLLVLAGTSNAITAPSLLIGNSPTGAVQTLRLGAGSNIVNANLINLGNGTRDSGVLNFAGATGTLTLRNLAGTGRVGNVNLGRQTAEGTAYTTANVVDFTGHSADVAIGTLAMALGAKTANNTNDFSFDQGTLDVLTVNMAVAKGTGTSVNRIVIGGGTVRLGGSTAFGDAGTGTVTLATAGSGELAITGGTVTSTANFVKGTGGTGTANLTLSGGTLDMGGRSIGLATQLIDTVTLTGGTLANLGQLNNGSTLAKTGSGILTLAGTNTYTGPTDIQAGEIRAGSAGGLSGSSTFAVGSGTFLSLAGNAASIGGLSGAGTVRNNAATAATLGVGGTGGTFSGIIEDGTGGGAIALTKTGSSLLALSGANTYTGGTTVSGGTLSIGAGGSTGSIVGNIVNDATVLFDRSNDLTYAGLISGSGAVSKSGAGNLTLAGANSYAGQTTVSGGFLTVGDASALGTTAAGTTVLVGGSVSLPGGITVAAEPLSLTDDGAVASAGALRNLAGTNTWGGPITVTAGATRIASAAGLLRLTGSVTTAGTGNFNVGGAGDIEITGAVSGPLVLFKSSGGAGTLTLSGASTYDAGVATVANVFANGIVSVASIGSVGSTSSNLGVQTTAIGATLGIGSGTTGATLRYTGTGETTDRIVNLRGTTGSVTLEQSGTGLLKFLSSFTATGAGSKTLFLQGSTTGTGEIAGAIVDNGGSNLTSLTKAGSGAWTLSGPSTYSGGTAVTAGRLVATNASALGVGNVTIASGSILELDVTPVLGSSTVAMTAGGRLLVASGVSVPLAGLSSLGGWEIDPSTLGRSTVAKLLSGTVLSGGTTLSGSWIGHSDPELFSDILALSGTGPSNPFVLSMTYDSSTASTVLERLNIGRRNDGSTGAFVNLGTSFQGVGVPWTSAFTTVGQYGVDTTNQTVWVVSDTNSEFVVVPEPASLALTATAAVGIALALRRRLRRAA